MVARIPPEDQFTRWRSGHETDILVSLASVAGERMFFDKDSSSGVSGDLESVIAVRYRLPVPVAPAFTMGNVILTRAGRAELPCCPALLAHEARHATQYAWCAGLAMLPLYFAAAAGSWVMTGDFGSRNIFETRAGLADGGYSSKPLRPPLARCLGRRPARP